MGIKTPATGYGEKLSLNEDFNFDDWYWRYGGEHEILAPSVRIWAPGFDIHTVFYPYPAGTKLRVEYKVTSLTNAEHRIHVTNGGSSAYKATTGEFFFNTTTYGAITKVFLQGHSLNGAVNMIVRYLRIWYKTPGALEAFTLAHTYSFIPLKNPLYEHWDRGGGQSTVRIADRKSASNCIFSWNPP